MEELWGASSVGVIGGAPKCAKTWLGLDMALSVATGTACLGKYVVPEPGPVLVYLAEDALPAVRDRVEGMARHRGLDLSQVEIHVITAPVLRGATGITAGNTTYFSGRVNTPHSTTPTWPFRGTRQRVGNTTIYRGH